MRLGTVVYALWCLAIVLGFTVATRAGYSPFASGGRPMFYGFGGGGPHHK